MGVSVTPQSFHVNPNLQLPVFICAVEPQATGTHVDPHKSANPAARKIVMVVKKVVEHIRKSSHAKVVVNAAVCVCVHAYIQSLLC